MHSMNSRKIYLDGVSECDIRGVQLKQKAEALQPESNLALFQDWQMAADMYYLNTGWNFIGIKKFDWR